MKLIIFAVSVKHGGWCVVGKNIDNSSQWFRLVRSESGSALRENEIIVNVDEKNRRLEIGDVVIIDKIKKCPLPYQSENILFNKMKFIEKRKCIDENFLDNESTIFGDEECYVESGKLKRNKSILLVKVSNLKIEYNEPSSPGEKPKTRADFDYRSTHYSGFRVTDPNCRKTESIECAYICISLGEPFNPLKDGKKCWNVDRHYKIIAAVHKCQ